MRVTIVSRNKNSNTYGGEIYLSDFYTNYSDGKNVANRIASSKKFDENCRKDSVNRERMR